MNRVHAASTSGSWNCRRVAIAGLQAACAAFALCVSAVFAAEASLEERFLKEAPERWLKYREIVARHTEGRAKGTNVIDYADKKRWFGEWDTAFALNLRDKQASAKLVKSEKGQAQSVEAFNPLYRFELKTGRSGKWTIQAMRTGAVTIPGDLIGRYPPRPFLMGEETTFGWAMHQACQGQKLGLAWLPRMVASTDFHATRVTPLGSQGLVKVEFTFEPKEMTGHGANARSGTLVLDSRRYWLVREADTEARFDFGWVDGAPAPERGTLSIRNTLTEAKMSVPYVSRQVYTAACDKGSDGHPWKEVDNTTIELRDVPEMDEKQFRLSGYGLPEPAKK